MRQTLARTQSRIIPTLVALVVFLAVLLAVSR
jgi:hypothetical protein